MRSRGARRRQRRARSTSQLSTTVGRAGRGSSVSTSTVLAGTGAVILAFRDVTAERALEHELRSTKEFLERLIDSHRRRASSPPTCAARSSCSTRAPSACSATAPSDVIGKIAGVGALPRRAWRAQIMRMLRSTSYGGVGRLEQTRREVRTRDGEIVPVSMTASIVYEGEREVATVGIVTDLRERIRMEQRLLAGAAEAAAHREAGARRRARRRRRARAQPAADVDHGLRRSCSSGRARPTTPHLRARRRHPPRGRAHGRASCKKIGRITRYETTDLRRLRAHLDLDRATQLETPAATPTRPSTEMQRRRLEKTREFAAVVAPRRGARRRAADDPAPTSRRPGDHRARSPPPASRRRAATRRADVAAGRR